jgi:hypothetical protein
MIVISYNELSQIGLSFLLRKDLLSAVSNMR